MALFVASWTTNVTTTGAAALGIHACRNGNLPTALIELVVTTEGAVTTTLLGLGRPAAEATVNGYWNVSPLDSSDPESTLGRAVVSNQWTGTPTSPTNFFRRILIPSQGHGVVWGFPRGLIIPAATSVVLWNIATGTTLAWVVTVDE